MTHNLDKYLQTLPSPDEKRLVGLEARVWQRIEASAPYAYFTGLPLWLKTAPIATALLFGATIGANASPKQEGLDIFSTTPSYSVTQIMVPCCG